MPSQKKSRRRITRFVRDSDPSKVAADKAEDRAQIQSDVILSFFTERAPKPLRADDVYDKINAHLDLANPEDRKRRVSKSTVHARLTTLEDAGKIAKSGKTESGVSGNRVTTWVLAQFAPEPTADDLLRRDARRSHLALIAALRAIPLEARSSAINACLKAIQPFGAQKDAKPHA